MTCAGSHGPVDPSHKMPTESRAAHWDARQAAVVAEFSEANAYVALARTAQAEAGVSTVSIAPLADGISLRCPGDRKSTLFNRVLGLGLGRPFDEISAAAVAARFADHDGPWGLEMAPAALNETARTLLKQLRLRRSLPTAMLAMACAEVTAPRPPGQVLRAGPEHAPIVADIVSRVFGTSAVVAGILRCAPASREFAQWIAFDGGLPAAVCLTHVRGDTGWFGWSATLPAHRGRGLQTALLWHSLRDAGERGCRWMTAETATGTWGSPDASFRNMRRFGFVELYRRHGYLRVPSRGPSRGGHATREAAPSHF